MSIKGIRFLPVIFVSFFVSCSSKPSDTEMQHRINIQLSGNVNYKEVSALVSNGTVTLSGNCQGENCITKVEKIVKENKYVDSVINQIQQISTGTDVALNTSLQKIMSNYPGVVGEVSDSIIILKGSIRKDRLSLLMREVSALYPKKVDDELVVKVN